MKKNNLKLKIFIIIINIIGIVCLIYFMIPYLRHDMSISNPNAMLSSYTWDTCGFILTIGFIPLLIVNIIMYKLLDLKTKQLKILFFLPSIICLIIVGHYLLIATKWREEKKKEAIAVMKCSINGKNYNYEIFQEENEEYSLGIDDNDNLPISIVDYTSKDTILNSIESYYKSKGGMCP